MKLTYPKHVATTVPLCYALIDLENKKYLAKNSKKAEVQTLITAVARAISMRVKNLK